MSTQESCCLRNLVNDECHSTRLKALKSFHKIKDLSEEDIQKLISRVPTLNIDLSSSICDYHHRSYIKYYYGSEKCFDPRNKHKRKVEMNLRSVELEFSLKASSYININIPCGQNICDNCFKQITKDINDREEKLRYCIDPFKRHRVNVMADSGFLTEVSIEYLKKKLNLNFTSIHKICGACNNQLQTYISEYNEEKANDCWKVKNNLEAKDDTNSESQSLTNKSMSSRSEFNTNSQVKRHLNSMLEGLGLPPCKRQKMNDEDMTRFGDNILQDVVDKFTGAFEDSHNIKLTNYNNLKQISNESKYFENIISNLKSKFDDSTTTYDERISILTVLPKDWSWKQTHHYFNCSKHIYYESQKLREEQGKIFLIIFINFKITIGFIHFRSQQVYNFSCTFYF